MVRVKDIYDARFNIIIKRGRKNMKNGYILMISIVI